MANKKKKNTCVPPTLKELPGAFSQQVSISIDDADVLNSVLRAALPQLAKKAAAESYGHNTAVKSINFASALHDAVKPVVDDFGSYHGGAVQKLAGELGINTSWRYEGKCGDTSYDVRDLYKGTSIEIHVVIKRELEDKKFLSDRGVK
jgi:hypothetical protein